MDDKVFLFIILIPGILLAASFYFMNTGKKGRLTYFITLALLFITNLIYVAMTKDSGIGPDFGKAVEWLVFCYLELIFLFFFAVVYGVISIRKK